MSREIGRAGATLRGILLVALAVGGPLACTEGASEPATKAAEEVPAEKAIDDSEPDEDPEPDEGPSRSVEELSEAELEAECFQGRREACDLLGH
jgi:hypothetical protein